MTHERNPNAGLGSQGISLVELIVVLAILGVVLGFGVFNGRRLLQERQEQAAVNSIRQSIWQGATAASSRGQHVTLERNNRTLQLMAGGTVLRTDELPSGVVTNLPNGTVLEFSPPGKVEPASLNALMSQIRTVTAGGRTYQLEVSIIGEVKVTEGP